MTHSPLSFANERRQHTSRAGFTLVELLVVLSIIAIILVVVLSSQSGFNRTLALQNAAYDLALTLRSAQTYGLGSRGFGANVANVGYGVDFNAATPSTFTLFADSYPNSAASDACHPNADPSAPDARPGDCAYEADQGEQISTYTLGNNLTVSNICVEASGQWTCASDGSVSSLDIVFARPNADVYMSENGAYSSAFPVSEACIILSSPEQDYRYVYVSSAGQILPDASSCTL